METITNHPLYRASFSSVLCRLPEDLDSDTGCLIKIKASKNEFSGLEFQYAVAFEWKNSSFIRTVPSTQEFHLLMHEPRSWVITTDRELEPWFRTLPRRTYLIIRSI
jgi:hypothetical protein